MKRKRISSPHQHSLCSSNAQDRLDNQLRKMGKAIGKNDGPVLNLLLSNHRMLSAYKTAKTLSNNGKLVQPIQIYRSLNKLSKLCGVHRLSTKRGFVARHEDGTCTSDQFLICDKCENVKNIDGQLLDREINTSAQKNDFSVSISSLEIQGLSSNCM